MDPSSPEFPSGGSSANRSTGGRVTWQPPSLEHMQALLPQYAFLKVLGRGGMGAVYQARQITLDRLVAIKILPPDIIEEGDEANFVERFRNEARTMAKMNHPGIVNVYDFGETSEGQLYFVMEFVDGTDVSQMIKSSGKLPAEHALAITAHVCDALEYAHRQGVMHRDIKPANVLINQQGQVKVADFGLAKANDPTMTALTRTNMAMGTPDFMAPEALIMGMPVDQRADLYAVGVMLYNMLTGEVPRGRFRPASEKAGTDPRFDAIINRAMESELEHRYQTAPDIRRELDAILTTPLAKVSQTQAAARQAAQSHSQTVPTRRQPSAPPRSAHPPPPAEKRFPLVTLVVAVVIVAAGSVWWLNGRSKQEAQPAATSTPTATVVTSPTVPVIASAPATPPAPATAPAAMSPSQPSPPQSSPSNEGFTALFDGSSLAGWRSATSMSDWTAAGGILTGGRGVIVTEREFGDFELELEWKVIPGGNGGVFFRLPSERPIGLECNLMDEARKETHKSGALFGFELATESAVRQVGEWNALRIILRGGKGEHWLNGRMVCSYDWNDPATAARWASGKPRGSPAQSFGARGYIGLQSLGVGGISYRNVRIRTLGSDAVVASASSLAPPSTSSAPPASTKTSADPRLEDLDRSFKEALGKQADAPYQANIVTLNQQYVTAIDRAKSAAQGRGALDDVLALDSEAKHVTTNGSVPSSGSTVPSVLATLRKTYTDTQARHLVDRNTRAAVVHDQYLTALDGYVAELTKANRIGDALRVKALRSHIAEKRAGLASSGPANLAGSGSSLSKTSSSSPGGPLIFDGRTLKGWEPRPADFPASVVDGAMRIGGATPGNDGSIYYRGSGPSMPQFTDFEVTLSAKTEQGGNSGLFIHASPGDRDGARANGIEAQIMNVIPNAKDGKGFTGGLQYVQPITNQGLHDGEWFDMKVRVEDKHVQVWVKTSADGQWWRKVNDWTQPASWTPPRPGVALGRGTISFQNFAPAGGYVLIKDIRLQLLSPSSSDTGASPGKPTASDLTGKTFLFSWKTDRSSASNGSLTLNKDGTLTGSKSPNEARWEMRGSKLVIKHSDGRDATFLDTFTKVAGKWRMEGPFLFRSGVSHILQEQ